MSEEIAATLFKRSKLFTIGKREKIAAPQLVTAAAQKGNVECAKYLLELLFIHLQTNIPLAWADRNYLQDCILKILAGQDPANALGLTKPVGGQKKFNPLEYVSLIEDLNSSYSIDTPLDKIYADLEEKHGFSESQIKRIRKFTDYHHIRVVQLWPCSPEDNLPEVNVTVSVSNARIFRRPPVKRTKSRLQWTRGLPKRPV